MRSSNCRQEILPKITPIQIGSSGGWDKLLNWRSVSRDFNLGLCGMHMLLGTQDTSFALKEPHPRCKQLPSLSHSVFCLSFSWCGQWNYSVLVRGDRRLHQLRASLKREHLVVLISPHLRMDPILGQREEGHRTCSPKCCLLWVLSIWDNRRHRCM